jgi:hypothetical protein
VKGTVNDGWLTFDTDFKWASLHLDIELLRGDAVRKFNKHSDLFESLSPSVIRKISTVARVRLHALILFLLALAFFLFFSLLLGWLRRWLHVSITTCCLLLLGFLFFNDSLCLLVCDLLNLGSGLTLLALGRILCSFSLALALFLLLLGLQGCLTCLVILVVLEVLLEGWVNNDFRLVSEGEEVSLATHKAK